MSASREPASPLPDLILYGKPGCHLCEETRELLGELLAGRAAQGLPAPAVVERDILTDEGWRQAYWETIPVLELDGRRLELAIRPAQLRAFLSAALDAPITASASGA